jgi:alpha-D-xyloside xylohydrolase
MPEFETVVDAALVRETPSGVVLSAEADRGNTAIITIDFCWEDTVRFRMFKQEHSPLFPLVHLPDTLSAVRVQRSDRHLQVCTDALVCDIALSPFEWSLHDHAGNLIWAEQRNDSNVRGSSNVPSLGFWQTADRIEKAVDSFAIEPDDRFYGFGEKFFVHNKRGHTITSWNLDAYGVETERAYKNIPFFLCSKGYGVLVNSTGRLEHAVGDPMYSGASYVLTVEDQQLDYLVIRGPSFKHILRRYADLTGYAPVPPQWAFGLWMSRCYFHNRAVVEEVARKLRDLDIPCDVVVFDGYWMRDAHLCDFVWDEERFSNPKEMLAGLKAQGFKSCVWEGPFVPSGTEMFEEAQQGGYLLQNSQGEDYLINTGLVMATHNREGFQGQEMAGSFDGLPPVPPAALPDFTNPEVVRWYQRKHEALMDLGVDVFKTDFGEQVPEDARSPYSGMGGVELHNLYTVLYNRAVFETTRQRSATGQGLVWARSGSIGSQQYPVHWGGDPQTSFSSMAGSLRGGLSLGLSGVPFWGHDIGGFFGRQPSSRLYIRWAQLGLLSGLSRCHGTTPREPWAYGEEAVDIFRKYAKLRYRLIPYLYSCAYVASQTGLPLMRPLVLEFQDDPAAHRVDSQYLLGDWLMIAPILTDRDRRTIYLPGGQWMDYWTHAVYSGPQYLQYEAALDTLPIFIRAGAILPLGPDMQYVGEKPFDPITLLLFPGPESSFVLQDDQEKVAMSCQTAPGQLTLEVSQSSRSYYVQIVGIPRPVHVESEMGEMLRLDRLDGATSGWTWEPESGARIKCHAAPFKIVVQMAEP